MADLDVVRVRARAASERARRLLALRRTLFALLAPALVLGLGGGASGALVLGALALGVGIATSYGRGVGLGAIEGTVVATIVVGGAALARGCALDGWHCGLPCLALGASGAIAAELAAPERDGGRGRRTTALALGAIGAFAGCAELGLGIALAAALATAIGRLGVVLLRPVLRSY